MANLPSRTSNCLRSLTYTYAVTPAPTPTPPSHTEGTIDGASFVDFTSVPSQSDLHQSSSPCDLQSQDVPACRHQQLAAIRPALAVISHRGHRLLRRLVWSLQGDRPSFRTILPPPFSKGCHHICQSQHGSSEGDSRDV